MLSLQINDPKIEKIFLEEFNSNKDNFFKFIYESYQKKKSLESFERSLKQAKLQESGELNQISIDELINELKNSSNA